MIEHRYKADLKIMKPIRPAWWNLWAADIWGMNISLYRGILMTRQSYDRWVSHQGDTSTIWHELVHYVQKRETGLIKFLFLYAFSRRHRAQWEREAYKVSMAWWMNKVRGLDESYRQRLVKVLSSWKYGWMMGEVEADEWVDKVYQELRKARRNKTLSFEFGQGGEIHLP